MPTSIDTTAARTADAAAASVAASQHGLLTTAQARAAGLSPAQVRRRVDQGRWERVVPGVYAIAGAPPSPWRTLAAAQLARPSSVVSHLAAAALHGLHDSGHRRPALIVPPGSSTRSRLARVHRLDLAAHHVTLARGIPCTAAARTVVDASAELGDRQLRRLVDRALHGRLATVAQVAATMAEVPRLRAGARATLLDALDEWGGPIRPGSPAEVRLERLLRSWGLPRAQRQVPIVDADGRTIARVDLGWPVPRLGIEYDSAAWHGPSAWAADERRHARIEALGWRLVRVDKGDLRPGASHQLRRRLEAALATGAPAVPVG